MAKLGFIGLGHMGSPMALNLIKSGHQVRVFDLSADVVNALVTQGAEAASSTQDVLDHTEIVFTMLPEGKHVRQVYLGEQGLLNKASKESFFCDCSTIDVQTAREIAAEAESLGHTLLDAPVSGGTKGAEAGTLSFMVGGKQQSFERVKRFLENMGKNLFYTGASGNGQLTKICNNMMLAVQMLSTCEAFVLAEKMGLDKQTLFNVASKSSGQCWSLTSYCPVPGPVPASPANNDYQAGFTAAMMLKDIGLSQMAAQDAGVETSMGKLSQQLYEKFTTEGQGEADFSGIIKML
jgi:3-hydroxyisobutyrate dehydrogenase